MKRCVIIDITVAFIFLFFSIFFLCREPQNTVLAIFGFIYFGTAVYRVVRNFKRTDDK